MTIVARKPIVPVVLARIDAMLDSLEKETISVDGVPRELLKREALDELEKVTKTIILVDQSLNVSIITSPGTWQCSDMNRLLTSMCAGHEPPP